MEEKADDYLKMEKNVLEKNINRKGKGGELWSKENILIVEEKNDVSFFSLLQIKGVYLNLI